MNWEVSKGSWEIAVVLGSNDPVLIAGECVFLGYKFLDIAVTKTAHIGSQILAISLSSAMSWTVNFLKSAFLYFTVFLKLH